MTFAGHLARLVGAMAFILWVSAVAAILVSVAFGQGFPKCGPHSLPGPRIGGAMVLYGCP